MTFLFTSFTPHLWFYLGFMVLLYLKPYTLPYTSPYTSPYTILCFSIDHLFFTNIIRVILDNIYVTN